MIDKTENLRLRPSVSIVSTATENVWEFFLSNTRQVRHLRIRDQRLIHLVTQLNGTSIADLVKEHPDIGSEIAHLFTALVEWCIVEYQSVSKTIFDSTHYRTLNFLSDFIPSYALLSEQRRFRNSKVILIGCGGVGSLLADGIAAIGVGELTLWDPDDVKNNNLNRGLFTRQDVGKSKVRVLADRFEKLYPDLKVTTVTELLEQETQISRHFGQLGSTDLVINAADYPNVDVTSKLIFPTCMNLKIPHIVAGGYNLHLSLIGPTIIPFETPCYKCIEMGLEQLQNEDFSHLRKLVRPKRNIGNLAPLAGISVSFTLNETIRTLLRGSFLYPYMSGRRGEFNYLNNQVNYTTFERQANCSWCSNTHKHPVNPS